MEDQSWQELRDRWERLRWARMRRFETAQAAAESMAMRPNTYTAYERPPHASKHTHLDDNAAIRFARKFGVRWVWLLTGDGTPFEEEPEPTGPQRRVRDLMGAVPIERQEAIANVIEALIKTGTNDR